MKRFLLSFVAVVGLLATSCVQDATSDMELNKQGVVTFAVDAQHTSRAYGDAGEATDLYYAVYQNGDLLEAISVLPVLPGEVPVTEPVTLVNGAANVSIPLATGLEYEFIFWAASPAAISEELYWLDWDAKTMTLNPDKLVTSDESLDAFYYHDTFTVEGTATRTITLKRPFAQINVATGDTEKAEDAGLTVAQTWFEVSGAFKTLNLATGFAEGSPVTLNYTAAAKPADEQIRANNNDYDLLGVIYVLANKDESPLNNVKFSYNRTKDGAAVKTIEVPSAPIKRNARTNLVGNILTSNNGFDVDIDEGFQGENVVVITNQDELNNALVPGATVVLADGTYDLTKMSNFPAGATIIGAGENVIINASKIFTVNGTATIVNAYVLFAEGGYTGFQGGVNLTMKDCTIEGQPFLYGEKATFEGCTFVQDNKGSYNVWTYAVKEAMFKNCVFNCDGRCVLVYHEGNNTVQSVTLDGCTFKAATPAGDGKAAVEIGASALTTGLYTVTINNSTANGFDEGSVSGNTLWNVKNGNLVNVTVDGNLVHKAGVGNVVDGHYTDAEGIHILNVDGWNWMEAQTDAYFSGKTILLDNDIDFENTTITATRFWDPERPTTVNGQNYTIKNIKVETALFNGTLNIKNLKVEDITVSGSGYVAVFGGNMYGNIENCHIKRANVTGTYWQVGGFAGQWNSGNINGCSIEESTITGPSAVGAVVGILNETAGVRKIENTTINKCAVVQNGSFGVQSGIDYDLFYGVVAGSINVANTECHFNNCDIQETTLKGVASTTLYGDTNASNTIFVDGVIDHAPGGHYEANNVVSILTAEGLTWFSDQLNNKNNHFAGKTIKVVRDIDMTGATYYGGSIKSYPTHNVFEGTFDGCENVISNLTITVENDGNGAAALIPAVKGWNVAIKNVTLTNVNISSSHYAAGIFGYVTSGNWPVVTNCHVNGGTISGNIYNGDNGDKVGGIAGIMYEGGINGCSVKNLTISGYRDMAGIVGYAAISNATIKNNTLENVTINVNNATNYKNYTKRAQYDVNSYVGEGGSVAKVEGNTGEATINWGSIAE